MGNHVVHGPHQGVAFHAHVVQQFQHGIGVVLAVEVRFQQVGQQQVGPFLPFHVPDYGIGDGHFPLALVEVGTRAVTGEVVEEPGPV